MMASNKRRRSSDEWRAVFARQASSGLSAQAEFVDLGSLGARCSRVADDCAVQHRHSLPPGRVELRLDLGEGLFLTLVRG